MRIYQRMGQNFFHWNIFILTLFFKEISFGNFIQYSSHRRADKMIKKKKQNDEAIIFKFTKQYSGN